MAEFASKGVAGTALGLGIAGTVGLLGQMSNNGCGNGGLFGNLFGGTNECYETKEAAALRANNAYWQATAETNQKITDAYTVSNNKLRERDVVIAGLATEAAVNRERNACQAEKIARLESTVALHGQEICTIKTEAAVNSERVMNLATATATRFETERREFYAALGCVDTNLRTYVDGNFVMAVKKISSSDICQNPAPVLVVDGSTIATTK